MHALVSNKTRKALTWDIIRKSGNRSLHFDRFADPTLEKEERKNWFEKTGEIPVPGDAVRRDPFVDVPGCTVLRARLMHRLMLNMAGGVMENAGLLLDRHGLPYIPGSAIKGCARRMGLQALCDWTAAGEGGPPADPDIGAPCRAGFSTRGEMLAGIAAVFGWVEQDWNAKSDFAWACGSEFSTVWMEACTILLKTLSRPVPESAPWKHLPNFAGSIAFLPARPDSDPGIEVDVLTPHHKDYYDGSIPLATDTEDPVPVFFPTVKAQKEDGYFTFPLLPLRGASADAAGHARTWLANGLAVFGIGAKTNAGYGWFDASEEINRQIECRILERNLVNKLEAEYSGFSDWPDSQKEETLLVLSDLKSECGIWKKSNSATLETILRYAEIQGIDLL